MAAPPPSPAGPLQFPSATVILNSAILPALRLAKAAVTGIGLPAVEPTINAVLEVATMLSTMKSNKEDLAKLENSLNTFITIDSSGPESPDGDLKQRLSKLSSELEVTARECKSLGEKHRLKRFFKSTEYKQSIQDIKNSVAAHIQDFTFYSNISIEKIVRDMATNVQLIDRKVDSVNTRVQGIDAKSDSVNRKVQGIGTKLDSSKMRDILASLKCVAARYNAANTPDNCMDGTRVDIIKDIVTQLTSTPDLTRVVMLSGGAGSGKSTIAKSVATILAQEKGFLAASFFFSRDHAERRETTHVATTLARQLADYNDVFRTHLVQLLEDDRTGIIDADPHSQFKKMVIEILGKMPQSSQPWVICLDALDECGKDRGQDLLEWLSNSIAKIPGHIQFFLTGRPDVPSYLKCKPMLPLVHGIILEQIDITTAHHDIQLYIEQSLDGANWTTQHPWKITSQEAEQITNHANGLFVFAATAVRYVRGGLPHVPPQKSVDFLLGGEPLTDLYALYYRIVEEAIPTPQPGNRQSQFAYDQAMKVLSTILDLFEPLDSQSLAALLELDTEATQRALVLLSAVIHVSDIPGTAIRIIHLSFREFMTSHVQMRRPEILCSTEGQQQALAVALMKVMHKELRFNICDLPTSYLRNIDMPDFQWQLDTYIPLHLRYACQFWVDHLSTISYKSDTGETAHDLLFSKFLFWLEVLSLTGMVDHGPRALSKLSAWAKKDALLVRFVTDAKRFLSFFREAIVQSAPHIYLSALALAPTESEISQRFLHQFPQLLSITTGQMRRWPDTIAVLEGHTDSVNSVAVSPDGRQIVSGSDDNTVRIWDAETGAALGEPLERHTASVRSVVFSPDSKQIVSGSNDGTLQIWDVETRDPLGEQLEGHTAPVTSVAFSPNGKQIVSGSVDRTVRIWHPQTKAALREPLEGHTDAVLSVAFSSDGKRIVSGSIDRTLQIWDTETGAAVGKPLEVTGAVTSVAFSPNGKQIVSGSGDNIVQIWDVETRAALGEPLEGHINWVASVAFSPNGKQIVSGSGDNTVHIWDTETGFTVGEPLRGHTAEVDSVTFSIDGKRIVSGSRDCTVRIWTAETRAGMGEGTNWVTTAVTSPAGKQIVSRLRDSTKSICGADPGSALWEPLEGHTGSVTSVAFSPDGKQIVSGSMDRTVQIWDAETGAALGGPLEGHVDGVASVAFSSNGKQIVSGSDDTTVRIWDAETGAAVGGPLEGHTDDITSVAFSPDGKQIVSGSRDGTVQIWDLETGTAVMEPVEGHTDGVSSVMFSPDSKQIASSSIDQTVQIWDAETGTALQEPLEGHTHWVTSVAFSPDGNQIVSGSWDCTLRIWDAKTGAAMGEPLEGHTQRIRSVAFSPNGKLIVSGSDDLTVRIWDATTGAALGVPLEGHTGGIYSVMFSPCGKRIVSGSSDRTVQIWDAEIGAVLGEPLGCTDVINSVLFSPDSKHVSGSRDHIVHISNAETGTAPESSVSGDTNGITSVASSPDSKSTVVTSRALKGCSLLNSLCMKSPSAPLHWQILNGWVSCIPSELLFWLPNPLRIGLWTPYTRLVISRHQTLLSYDKFVHGADWAKCYAPEESL